MLKTTRAEITVDGQRISSVREGYLTAATSEELLDKSLDSSSFYGRDLMMFAEGDLFVEEREKFTAKDLQDVGGLLNYAQAITHRLMSTRGYHPGDSQFGVPWTLFLGQTYTSKSAVTYRLIAEITEEIMKDHRTSTVLNVDVNFESPTHVSVNCSVLPVIDTTKAIEIALELERV